MRRRYLAALFLLIVAACKGDVGPVGPQGPAGTQGPQGPAGPMGPAGKSVSYQVFEGPVSSTTMATSTVSTGGVVPGIVCYVNHTSAPGVWSTWDTNAPDGTLCAVVQDGSGYFGSAVFPSSFVNSGWTLRIVLFWLPA